MPRKRHEIMQRSMSGLVRSLKLSLDVERKLDDGTYKHRKHAGRVVLNLVTLPERFRRAADELLARTANASSASSTTVVTSFFRYLASRRPPTEDQELRRKAVEMERDLLAERLNQSTPQGQSLESKDKAIILRRLRAQTYHWEPINYSSENAITYLCARAAPDFAVLTQIFSDVRARLPDFSPKALLDFGSGIGTAIWAANGIWENSIKEYFAVDTSSHMNDIARLLMQGGREGSIPFVRGTFFRQFLPASHTLRYDLVVSAFSLMELPNRLSRRQTLENLWNKTEEFLIIVETGSNAGFRLVMEARSHLVRQASDANSIEVFAPCNHKLRCPRLVEQRIPCNFEVGYEPLLTRRCGKMLDRFSYVVLRKRRPACEDPEVEEDRWPRIVSEVLVRPRHVVCRMCDSDGQLREVVVTAKKHGRNLYRCAKACRWGDRLPVMTVPEQE